MSEDTIGLDYDGLKGHNAEREKKEKDKWSKLHSADSEDELYKQFNKIQAREKSGQIHMLMYSIPAKYKMQFNDTVMSFAKQARPDISKAVAFGAALVSFQDKFFGEDPIYEERRRKYAQDAAKIGRMASFSKTGVYQNYGTLVGLVEDEKLDFYAQQVKRANEININFTEPMSEGLVGVLINMKLRAAKVFVSETYELLDYDAKQRCANGLFEASAYITRQTDHSMMRFLKLADIK